MSNAAYDLATRASHIASTTIKATNTWTDSTYIIESFGSSLIMQRIMYLDKTEEYIFRDSIHAICWVELHNEVIVVHAFDDHERVDIEMKILDCHTKFNTPTPTRTPYAKQNTSSPTSVIPTIPINIIRPIAVKTLQHETVPIVFVE